MIFLPFIYFIICGAVTAFLCLGFINYMHQSKISEGFKLEFKTLFTLPRLLKSERNEKLKSKILVLYYLQFVLIPFYFIGYYELMQTL